MNQLLREAFEKVYAETVPTCFYVDTDLKNNENEVVLRKYVYQVNDGKILYENEEILNS